MCQNESQRCLTHVSSTDDFDEGEVVVGLVVTSSASRDDPVLEVHGVEAASSWPGERFQPGSTSEVVADEVEHSRVDHDLVSSSQLDWNGGGV